MKPNELKEHKELKEGSTVAYIFNSMWIVPATISRIYPDLRCDLEIQRIIPSSVRKVIGKGTGAKVESSDGFIIQLTPMKNVAPCDPRSIIRRNPVLLERPQSGGGLSQTHTDVWEEVGKSRLPKFGSMPTSLVGKFFDPSIWNYKICAQMDGFYHKTLQQAFEPIEMNFPIDLNSSFLTFEECFKEWFAEAFESRYMIENGIPHSSKLSRDGEALVGEWTRCEIQAIEKLSYAHISEIGQNANVQNSQSSKRNPKRAKASTKATGASKSRKPRTHPTLSGNRGRTKAKA